MNSFHAKKAWQMTVFSRLGIPSRDTNSTPNNKMAKLIESKVGIQWGYVRSNSIRFHFKREAKKSRSETSALGW